MKRIIATLVIAVFMFTGSATFAADDVVTIKGSSECAKCTLKKADSCNNAVKVKEGDKEVIYFMVKNDVHKANHKKFFCKGGHNVTVKGTVKVVDGKKMITATEVTETK
jgi:hypothetical protein